jgi:regulator of protease activity HflC (stomatin/prohibitin superfamily)
MFSIIRIRQHERGLWFRHGDFKRLLAPGAYFFPLRLVRPLRDRVETFDTLKTYFTHPLLDVLLQDPTMRDALHVVDLTDSERALVWRDDRLAYILGPGRHALWKTPYRLYVETYHIGQAFRFEHPRLQTILAHPSATTWLDAVQVDAGAEALLYRDGVLIERLGEGLYVYWKGTGKVRFRTVDLREQVADVAGQEIITADKVSLRVNLVVTYVVSDALRAVNAVADYAQALYREAQLALRAAVGTKTIDALLADKEAVGGEVRAALAARVAEFGLVIRGVGLRDIILPGDMRTLLNQVVAASKEAEANLIRRREETASVRSQANTAKLLADNPQLARLKELELLKEVLAGTTSTFIFGEGDLVRQVKGLVAQPPKSIL